MGTKGGAPALNQNAARSGLYTSQPARTVRVPENAGPGDLAQYAQALADLAFWIAEALADAEVEAQDEAARLSGLYAAVANELWQEAAVMAGETGIRPAALGRLGDEAYQALQARTRAALSLVLSQCHTAARQIQVVEEIRAASAPDVAGRMRGALVQDGEINPVLRYLASQMRTAKRMLRDMAANAAWQSRGTNEDSDLATRIMDVLRGES